MRCCGMLAAVHVCVQQFTAPTNMFTRISAHRKAAQAPTCCTDLSMQLKAELVTCCGRCNNPAGLQMPHRHRGEACTESGSAKEATLCTFLPASFRTIPVTSCYASLDCPFDPQSKDSRMKVSGKCKEGHGSVKDCKEWQGILWTPLPFL